MNLVLRDSGLHAGQFGDLMALGRAIISQQQGPTGLTRYRSMDHQLIHGFHWHQYPSATDMARLSTPPSRRTCLFFLNWFLPRFILGWRL